jgi:hypothetical protein|tara:strand:- start:1414 stop:1536 length:123 start_codon:yes stop_codon:yes gene_type:complete
MPFLFATGLAGAVFAFVAEDFFAVAAAMVFLHSTFYLKLL